MPNLSLISGNNASVGNKPMDPMCGSLAAVFEREDKSYRLDASLASK